MKWVDHEWPIPLKQGLARIWSLYEEENRKRLRQQVTNAEENLKSVEHMRKIENELRSYKIDFAKTVADKEDVVTQLSRAHRCIGDLREELEKKKMADKTDTSIHQVLRAKAEKERDQMKLEKEMWMEQMKQEKAMWMEEMNQEKGKWVHEREQMEQMKQEKGKWVEEREQIEQEKVKWLVEREEMEQEKAKLKLEKKKVEYSLHDVFYDREALRDKLIKIRDVLDE